MNTALAIIAPTALVIDENYRIITPPEAIAYRDALLAETTRFQTVDFETVEILRTYLATESRLRIGVEKTRVEIGKEPLKITRRINDDAAAYIDPIKADEKRLRDMIGAYELGQEEKRQAAAREAARLAQIERDRIASEAKAESDRQAAAAKAAADEAAAKAAAELAMAAPADDIDAEIAAAAAIDAANEARAERARIEAANALAAQQARAAAALAESEARKLETVATPKASFYWDFEVVNMRAFVQHCIATNRESLFTAEVNRRDVLEILKASGDETPAPIPGLTIVKRARVR